MKGGKLPVVEIEKFLNESYNPSPSDVDTFQLTDKTETTRTYWNGSQCVFVIRGTNPTMNDWSNNLSYLLGSYKETPRFKEAQQAYNEAVSKYGEKNITVLGHSQGGGSSSFFPNAKEIITLNRAYKGESIPKNEYDIHATLDPVSTLLNFRKPPNDIPIKSISINPLKNHSIDILKLLEPTRMIGQGINNGLTDSELKLLCKHFKIPVRVYEKDDVNHLSLGNYIINLNGHSHWCSMIISPRGNFWWDSYGFPAPENIEDLIDADFEKIYGKTLRCPSGRAGGYIWNDRQIQDMNSTACGYFCVAFLKFMKSPSKEKYEAFCELFKNPKNNDKILFSLLRF